MAAVCLRYCRLAPGSALADSGSGGYIGNMGTRRKMARYTVLLCLLLLQLQVYAAGSLACQHWGTPWDEQTEGRGARAAVAHAGAGLTAACPHAAFAPAKTSDLSIPIRDGSGTAQADPNSAQVPPERCQKCALDLCISGGLGLLVNALNLSAPEPSNPEPGVPSHFYRFTPDPARKPPIAVFG